MTDNETRRDPRLRLACARCQRRKIRCDRRYPICSNCGKASAECIDGDSVRLRPARSTRAHDRKTTQYNERITWLEAIIRERLPDVDLSIGPAPTVEDESDATPSQETQQPLQEDMTIPVAAPRLLAGQQDQRAHEIGLISVAPNADQQYLGPSSGYFLARLLLACSPRRQEPRVPMSKDFAGLNQEAINNIMSDLVESHQGALPLPDRSTVDRLSQVYFYFIHPQWPVLHEPTFQTIIEQTFSSGEHALQSDRIDPYGLFQIFMVSAISATILSFKSRRQLSGESYCLSALQYFDRLDTQTSLPGLQCLLLLLIFSMHNPHVRLNAWYLNYQCIARVLDLGLQRNITAATGISLLKQEMRTRVFWVVFTMDRTIATMMGRPIGLRDEACELRLPQCLCDNDLTPSDPSITNRNNHMEYSVHLFKLAKLNSEIKYVANSIVRDAPAYAYPPVADVTTWQQNMLSKLDKWDTEIPCSGDINKYAGIMCKVRCRTIKMLLLRPSPAILAPSPEMLLVCHETARQTIHLYQQLYVEDALMHDWISLHGVVCSTITLLYCIRTMKELARNIEPEMFMADMNISLSILSAVGEHWTSAKRSRHVLDDLGKSTLEWINIVRSTDRDTSEGLPLPYPVSIRPPVNQSSIASNDNLLGTFNSFDNSNDPSLIPSSWLTADQQEYAFSDFTNVDEIMRNLFDGFVPQLDNFDAFQGF